MRTIVIFTVIFAALLAGGCANYFDRSIHISSDPGRYPPTPRAWDGR